MTGRIRAALDHGVFLLRLNGRFSRLTGIELDVFYLMREGEIRGEPEWQAGYTDFEPVLLSRQDLELIAPEYFGNDIAGLRSRYDRGHICVGLKHEDSFAAVTWADLEECSYESLHFAMAENEAYLYDAFTLPEYRGKGLAPYMRYQCYELLKAMGRDRFYSVSAYLNKPAIRFKQKLDARFEKLYVSIATKSGKKRTWKVKTY